MFSKIAGTSYHQEDIKKFAKEGMPVLIVEEPSEKYPYALGVYLNEGNIHLKIGFIPEKDKMGRQFNKDVVDKIHRLGIISSRIEKITDGGYGMLGVNIYVEFGDGSKSNKEMRKNEL